MSPNFHFTIDADKCRGCRRCEAVCAWQNGLIEPAMSAILIYKVDEKGKNYPVINTICQEQFCAKAPLANSQNSSEDMPVPRCVSSCFFGALNFSWEVETNE